MRLPGSLEISSPRHLAVPPLYKRRRVAEADIQMPRDVCFHLFCFFRPGFVSLSSCSYVNSNDNKQIL